MSQSKAKLQRRLEREQLAIERRLAAAVGPNLAGPLLQAAPIRYEWSERDRGLVHGGIGRKRRTTGMREGNERVLRRRFSESRRPRLCVGVP